VVPMRTPIVNPGERRAGAPERAFGAGYSRIGHRIAPSSARFGDQSEYARTAVISPGAYLQCRPRCRCDSAVGIALVGDLPVAPCRSSRIGQELAATTISTELLDATFGHLRADHWAGVGPATPGRAAPNGERLPVARVPPSRRRLGALRKSEAATAGAFWCGRCASTSRSTLPGMGAIARCSARDVLIALARGGIARCCARNPTARPLPSRRLGGPLKPGHCPLVCASEMASRLVRGVSIIPVAGPNSG
jgi:hypothetical protein